MDFGHNHCLVLGCFCIQIENICTLQHESQRLIAVPGFSCHTRACGFSNISQCITPCEFQRVWIFILFERVKAFTTKVKIIVDSMLLRYSSSRNVFAFLQLVGTEWCLPLPRCFPLFSIRWFISALVERHF